MFWNKKIFSPTEGIAIGVINFEAARQWYKEKLGLSYSTSCAEAEEGSIVLGYSDDDLQVYLCEITGTERPDVRPGHPPILFAKKLEAAHEYLSSRGVDVGPVQSDSGGNQFFRFRDLEDNEVEVCEET